MSVLVTKQAPDFIASAVMPDGTINGEFKLSDYIKNKYAVLFFYPLDFTFVCPTEIIAHDKRVEEFKSRGVEVIAVSIDSQYAHFAWRNTPINEGGIGKVRFPMVSDVSHSITRDYGVEHPASLALRASFLIDRAGIVRHQTVNDLPIGRNVDEMLRLVDALQFTEKHGEVCPAGWHKGDKGMTANSDGVASYLESNASKL